MLLGAVQPRCLLDRPAVPVTPLPVPPSWPAGDPYLLQSEAALPSLSHTEVFRDPRLHHADRSGASPITATLQVAAANIAAARAQSQISRAGACPK